MKIDVSELFVARLPDNPELSAGLVMLAHQSCDLSVLLDLLATYRMLKSMGPLKRVQAHYLERRKDLRRLRNRLKGAMDVYFELGEKYKSLPGMTNAIPGQWVTLQGVIFFLDCLVGHKGALKKEAWLAAAVEYTRSNLGRPCYQHLADTISILNEIHGESDVSSAEIVRKRSKEYLQRATDAHYWAAGLAEGLLDSPTRTVHHKRILQAALTACERRGLSFSRDKKSYPRPQGRSQLT